LEKILPVFVASFSVSAEEGLAKFFADTYADVYQYYRLGLIKNERGL